MVLSLLGALAGAGGGIASALLGADAQDNAYAWNNYINERNLSAQKKQQQQAIDYANEIRGEQKLGSQDALGNRTYFKDGVGWVVDLSPEQQALYDYFFKQELPERQAQFGRQADASRTTADTANQLLDQFTRVRKDTPRNAAAKLYYAATRGAADAERNTAEAALRQAARTGNSNISSIINQLSKAAMDNRADARMNAELQADDYINQKYNNERGGLAQLYAMFAGQANQSLNPSYDPTSIAPQANNLLSLMSQQSQQGNSMGFNAMSQPAPQMKNIEPNMSSANAAGAIGQALAGLGTRVGGMQQQNNMNNLLMQYLTAGGQLNMPAGGIWGSTADRNRAGGGII